MRFDKRFVNIFSDAFMGKSTDNFLIIPVKLSQLLTLVSGKTKSFI